MPETSPPDNQPLASPLQQATECPFCRYSLAGLSDETAGCPECGARLDPEVFDAAIRRADRKTRVRWGLGFFLGPHLITLLLSLVGSPDEAWLILILVTNVIIAPVFAIPAFSQLVRDTRFERPLAPLVSTLGILAGGAIALTILITTVFIR